MTQIILTKQGKLDGSLKHKAYAFLQKLTEDHTSPGLHIEPIIGSADSRARTGRVDQQFRAVLFQIHTDDDTVYIFHGIYNHDDAIDIARRVVLRSNPVNGLPEFTEQTPSDTPTTPAPPTAARTAPRMPSQPKAAAVPRLSCSLEALTDELGFEPALAQQVLEATSDDALLAIAETQKGWASLAVLELIGDTPIAEVRKRIGLDNPNAAAPQYAPGDDSDAALLEALSSDAAASTFHYAENQDELRRIIEDGDFASWRTFLHPEQKQYVGWHTKGPFRISGGAGTGKTVVLVHRARELARRYPNSRIILTTFTTNLARSLQDHVKALDPSLPLVNKPWQDGIYAVGVDSLANGIVRQSGKNIAKAAEKVLGVGVSAIKPAPTDSYWREVVNDNTLKLDDKLRSVVFLRSEYEQIILPSRITTKEKYLRARRQGRGVSLTREQRLAVWRAIEAYKTAARANGVVDFHELAMIAATFLDQLREKGVSSAADHVLVDEGQDLAPAHWCLLRALAAEGPDDITIAEDAHQRIYGGRLVLSRYGIKTQGRSRSLRLNYRTTAENLRFGVDILSGANYENDEGFDAPTTYRSARNGPEPVVQRFSSLTDELDFVASQIRQWTDDNNVAKESIGVLVRENKDRDRVLAGINDRGVSIRSVDRDPVMSGTPVVMTMHRAKGTEFVKVIVMGVSDGALPAPFRDPNLSEPDRDDMLLKERSVLYVATTRARDELVVTYSGTASSLLPDV